MVKNLQDLMIRFQTEEACRDYLIQQRWNGVPTCPKCGCRRSYKIEKGKRFKCANPECYKKYSVTVGTIFESSNIPLTTWLPAVYLITANKKGISSIQLSKHLGVTQKTAWFMLHRIRESLREKAPLLLTGTVQADETYVGGVEANKHEDKKAPTLEEASNRKTPVVGMVETGGRVVSRVIPWVNKRNITDLILQHVDRNAVLVTDYASCYLQVGKKFEHVIINSQGGERKVGPYHKNAIENYWSLFKRVYMGTYHWMSHKHLQRYCDELDFRFNSRTLADGFRFVIALQQIEGRLTYKELIVNGEDPKKEGGTPFYPIETGE